MVLFGEEDGLKRNLGFIHHIRLFLLPFHVFSYLYGCIFPIDGLIFIFSILVVFWTWILYLMVDFPISIVFL